MLFLYFALLQQLLQTVIHNSLCKSSPFYRTYIVDITWGLFFCWGPACKHSGITKPLPQNCGFRSEFGKEKLKSHPI